MAVPVPGSSITAPGWQPRALHLGIAYVIFLELREIFEPLFLFEPSMQMYLQPPPRSQQRLSACCVGGFAASIAIGYFGTASMSLPVHGHLSRDHPLLLEGNPVFSSMLVFIAW